MAILSLGGDELYVAGNADALVYEATSDVIVALCLCV